jgi:flagellar motility protein MotE (MotC chaperone)
MMRIRSKASKRSVAGPRRRPGVLLILAALLVASGAIRIGDGVGQALAETAVEAPAAEPAVQPEMDGAEAAAPGEPAAADGAQGCAADPGTAAMLAAIMHRNDGLDQREARIADRERAVELAQTAIEARLAALVTAEEELAQTITMADSAAEDDVARLVAVYENMKPKDAIPVAGCGPILRRRCCRGSTPRSPTRSARSWRGEMRTRRWTDAGRASGGSAKGKS